jgi:hypothetical protein
MANLTRNFIAGRMNKVVDERLLPDGEYVDAMNIRMGSTEIQRLELFLIQKEIHP